MRTRLTQQGFHPYPAKRFELTQVILHLLEVLLLAGHLLLFGLELWRDLPLDPVTRALDLCTQTPSVETLVFQKLTPQGHR
jgi:hypothetical protein